MCLYDNVMNNVCSGTIRSDSMNYPAVPLVIVAITVDIILAGSDRSG